MASAGPEALSVQPTGGGERPIVARGNREAAAVIVVDQLFDDALLRPASDALEKAGFRYGWHSAGNSPNKLVEMQRHWHYEVLGGGTKNEQDFTAKLEASAKEDASHGHILALWQTIVAKQFGARRTALLRCYANQHTYGTEGYPHRDSHRPGETSVVVYMNDVVWKPEWGGETAFYDDAGEIVRSVLPKFGRVVLFPSEMVHAARSLSRICILGRRTLIYKARVET